jgi:hypothetical protein
MSRRFSDEPINLIHRIPTPEQLSAARPVKRSLVEVLMELSAACMRGVGELCVPLSRALRLTQTTRNSGPEAQAPDLDSMNEKGSRRRQRDTQQPCIVGTQSGEAVQQPENDETLCSEVAESAAVQPDEVAELRSYLLTQQHDIARLAAQVQELKSLVVSQQQVLVYLGKELEISSLTSITTGVASASGKRNRPLREKPAVKDKPVVRKDPSKPSSLSF